MASVTTLQALLLTATVAITLAATPLEFGMEMSVRAYDSVCWYENLKQFPDTHSSDYGHCSDSAKMQKTQIMTKDFFKKYPDKKEKYFGKWIDDMSMESLPEVYKESCEKYLDDSKMPPAKNESDALNDGGNDYPYKGYAYCMMSTLRKEHGEKAIEDVKNERTRTKKNWMQTLLDRENEFRARHGVEPLQLVKDLNDAAQQWAETNANKCDMYHSDNSDTGRQWRGDGTGESLSASEGDDASDISAYLAADGWYEEIKNYPYPDGYQGGDEDLFMKIGHFTQSVWKGSKYVGYGYAFNEDCKNKGTYTRYVAARYSPAGNVDGEYPKNVNPPKKT